MKILGLDQFANEPRLSAALERASGVLESEMGRSARGATAEWGRVIDDRGRPLITLKLTDWGGSSETRFEPSLALIEPKIDAQIHRFWGDFLQESSHLLLRPILQSIREHEGV